MSHTCAGQGRCPFCTPIEEQLRREVQLLRARAEKAEAEIAEAEWARNAAHDNLTRLADYALCDKPEHAHHERPSGVVPGHAFAGITRLRERAEKAEAELAAAREAIETLKKAYEIASTERATAEARVAALEGALNSAALGLRPFLDACAYPEPLSTVTEEHVRAAAEAFDAVSSALSAAHPVDAPKPEASAETRVLADLRLEGRTFERLRAAAAIARGNGQAPEMTCRVLDVDDALAAITRLQDEIARSGR